MYDGLYGPWYPSTVRHCREVDALPVDGSVVVVGTWELARRYRQGILLRRGADIAARTALVSMGARDVVARLTGSKLPVVITADVRAYCPRSRLATIERLAASVNARTHQN